MSQALNLIGNSPKFQEIMRTLELVAVTDVPVLLSGETGTGKDTLAQAIHQKSPRKQHALITVNCAALPDEHAEAMLFGYQKGAFNEATQSSIGYMGHARSGSVYFDEVAELPLSIQAKLLRFIEQGEIQPVGYATPRQCNVRVIASSRIDLAKEVEQGRFRADLYYRLNVIPLELPALKDRENDVMLLVDHFMQQLVKQHHKAPPTLSKAAQQQVRQYHWPGNIRELHNFCERMFLLFSGGEIEISNLPVELRRRQPHQDSIVAAFQLPSNGINLESIEIELMCQALQKTHGNKTRAARLLGLTRDTFLYRLKKYSIDGG